MNVEDILDRLPFELAARLACDPFFVDIPIAVAVKGNVAAEYAQRQAVIAEKSGKSGVAVIVLQIQANDIYQGLPGAPMKLKPSFQVIENVELNVSADGTKKSARKVARYIIKNLKISNFRGLVRDLRCANPAIEPLNLEDMGPGCVCEVVNFECEEFCDEKFLYCLPPIAATVPGSNPPAFTLTSATPGAVVWYTLDDTFPYNGTADQYPASTAQQYAAPITTQLNTPVLVRAAAYLPGYVDSSIERFTVTITSNP